MVYGSAITTNPGDSGRVPLLMRLGGIVDKTVSRAQDELLEYRQLKAAIASGRPVAAGTALERLVGRCWDDLSLASRAQLLGLATALRGGLRAESERSRSTSSAPEQH